MSFNWPEGYIETKFGKVHFVWTQADHVSLSTDQGGYIQVNRVLYHVHLHLHLRDGQWIKEQGDRIYLQRPWTDKNCSKDPSHEAREAAIKELTRVWVEYADQHPEQADEAERTKLDRDFETLRGEIVEMENALDAKRKQLKIIHAALKKLGGRLTV